MRLSTRTQYGLRMLCQLAMEYNKGPMQMGEIGRREGISEKYLGQIMLILRSSGLVLSIRGAQGGYYLAKEPRKVTLREAFEILEGEVLGVESGDVDAQAKAQGRAEAAGKASPGATALDMREACSVVWSELRSSMVETLERYTLEDLMKSQLSKRGLGDYSI